MAHINLLPWRQELRRERQRQFFTLMGLSVVLMVLIIFAVHLQYSRMISAQNSRNAYLNTQIEELNTRLAKIKKLEKERDKLARRIEKIKELQANRPKIVQMFDEMVRIIPDGMYLTLLQQTGKTIRLEGIAQSNERVSSFMRNIDEAVTLTKPVLEVIKQDPKTPEDDRIFIVTAQQDLGKPDEEGAADPGAPGKPRKPRK